MKVDYLLIAVLVIGVTFLIGLLAGLVYFKSTQEKANATTKASSKASSTTSLAKVSTSTTSTTNRTSTSTSSARTSSTSTSTVILPALTVDAPETNLYKGDDAEITILSEGVPVEGVEVYLDGVWKQNSDEYGMAMLSSLSGGLHLIYGVKEGYLNASLNLTVSNLTYAYSGDAKIQHTQDERNRMISQGKIILIFFDLPGCANCALMRPWIAELANENRGCIEYEWLNLAGVSEGPRNELREVIQDEDQVSTPVIIIQGENGSLLSSGFKSRDAIIDMISRVSNGGCFSET